LITLGIVASGSHQSAISAISGVTYFLGGPIVHWAHGYGAKGAIDLGIRFGAPVVGALLGLGLGSAANSRPNSDAPGVSDGALVGAVLGAFLGLIAAITVDAAVLATEDVTPTGPQARSKPPLDRFVLVPTASLTPTKTTLGLGLRF
jgi:hypothetical protein